MYVAIWRNLPGPLWLRLFTATALVLGVLAALAFWIFPFVDQLIAAQEVTVQ